MKSELYKKSLKKPAKASAGIRVERPIKHLTKRQSFYRVLFTDMEGQPSWVDIPRKAFSKPAEAAAQLLDAHAHLPIDKKEQEACIVQAVESMGHRPTLNITDRVGWTTTGKGNKSFVYFNKTFGPQQDTLSLDRDPNRNAALGQRSGNAEAWRVGLAPACDVSDEMVVAICIAASGPLYEMMGEAEACIYHFEGARKPPGDHRQYKSSSGKTLCARVAQSMFGKCDSADLFSFNMTSLAVEETCFSCNDLTAVLDEEGTAAEGGGNTLDPKTLPYRIIGGQGKRRSKHYSSSNGLATQSWVVPVITTAEDELDTGKSKRKEGEQVRMVAVPFPPTWEGGTFARVKKEKARSDLAKQVEGVLASNYGVAMPRYLKYLIKHRKSVASTALKARDAFVEQVGAAGNTWERRFARKFGILLAAAVALDNAGLAPWTGERGKSAITNVYRRSRSLTVPIPQATDQLLARLKRLVAAKKRFPRLPKGKLLTSKARKLAWGAVRTIDRKKNITAIKGARFDKLVRPAAAAHAVLDELESRGLLVKGSKDHLKRQLLIKAISCKRLRYVCIKGLVGESKLKA